MFHSAFNLRASADLLRLVDECPLATIVSSDADVPLATPLPLLAEVDADHRLVSLLGHFARANPHVERLRATPNAVVLFHGPHAYLSPRWVSKPRWGPTWNYVIATLGVRIEFVPEETEAALNRLVAHMERDAEVPWQTSAMGERFGDLARHVIAFRAQVLTASARFKLGQDEDLPSLNELLSEVADTPLEAWMRDFNAPRLRASGIPTHHTSESP